MAAHKSATSRHYMILHSRNSQETATVVTALRNNRFCILSSLTIPKHCNNEIATKESIIHLSYKKVHQYPSNLSILSASLLAEETAL